jgi:hypothetical protein
LGCPQFHNHLPPSFYFIFQKRRFKILFHASKPVVFGIGHEACKGGIKYPIEPCILNALCYTYSDMSLAERLEGLFRKPEQPTPDRNNSILTPPSEIAAIRDPYTRIQTRVRERGSAVLEVLDSEERRAAHVLITGGTLRRRVTKDGLTKVSRKLFRLL